MECHKSLRWNATRVSDRIDNIQAFISVEQQQILARRARMSKQGQIKAPQKTEIKAISVPVYLE
jgi:hypothetical protein